MGTLGRGSTTEYQGVSGIGDVRRGWGWGPERDTRSVKDRKMVIGLRLE